MGSRLPRVREESHGDGAHRLRAVLRSRSRTGPARGGAGRRHAPVGGSLAVRIKLPTILRPRAGGQAWIEGDGSTLRELLADLESRYPGLTRSFMNEEGDLHRFVNIYVNDEDVRYLGALETSVRDGDIVSILPAVAGG
ncbi:MAG TPA: MoaD family protein [Actinomycetota bacterium]|nr:MoaD family protein [Actinomycetota bacterium]